MPAMNARRWLWLVALAGMLVLAWTQQAGQRAPEPARQTELSAGGGEADARQLLRQGLPREAVETLRAIQSGGPFPYDRDGTVFQNREGRLPARPRGYYREYTVPTPGAPNRGARRIVAGGQPPAQFWYTEDHYRSFRLIEMPDP